MKPTTYITSPAIVTLEEHEFIQSCVLADGFPWFYQGLQTYGENIPVKLLPKVHNASFFCHILLSASPSAEQEGTVNSTHFDFFNNIFQRWLEQHKIDCHFIYRAAVNLVEHVDKEMTVPHTDHLYPHKSWIMYLNTVDSAETVLFDADYNITANIPCKQYEAVTFGGELHSHRYPPKYQRRLAVVFTYMDAATV